MEIISVGKISSSISTLTAPSRRTLYTFISRVLFAVVLSGCGVEGPGTLNDVRYATAGPPISAHCSEDKTHVIVDENLGAWERDNLVTVIGGTSITVDEGENCDEKAKKTADEYMELYGKKYKFR